MYTDSNYNRNLDKKGQNRAVEFLIVSGFVPWVESLTVAMPDKHNSNYHKTSIFCHQKFARRKITREKIRMGVIRFNLYFQNLIVQTVTPRTVKIYGCFVNQRKLSII